MSEYRIYWNRHDDEKKYLVGVLCHNDEWVFWYNLKNVEEAINKGFCPFPELPVVGQIYTSPIIFKTFKYRLNENLLTDNIMVVKEGENYEKDRRISYSRNR